MIFRAEHAAVDLLVAFAARRARHAKVALINRMKAGDSLFSAAYVLAGLADEAKISGWRGGTCAPSLSGASPSPPWQSTQDRKAEAVVASTVSGSASCCAQTGTVRGRLRGGVCQPA